MSFNSTVLSTPMTRCIMRTGDLSSYTTFTSDLETIKWTSDHLGAANQVVNMIGVYFRMVPHVAESASFQVKTDNSYIDSTTFSESLNPFSYALVASNSTVSTFTLATSANDSTASGVVDDDDTFTFHEELGASGRVVEFTISSSTSVDVQIVGMEGAFILEGKNPEYV